MTKTFRMVAYQFGVEVKSATFESTDEDVTAMCDMVNAAGSPKHGYTVNIEEAAGVPLVVESCNANGGQ